MAGHKKKSVKKTVKQDIVAQEEDEEIVRRADWEHNHALIYSAFIKLATEKLRYPKLREIASATGLSIKTIHEHIESTDFDEMKKKYTVFSEAALFRLSTNAAAGKSKEWMELFFRVVHGVGDKKQMDITSGGKRIGMPDLSKLTDDELLVLKSIKGKVDAS